MTDTRIGMGYDVHRLTCGRELFIGCINIPYTRGLLGHSDADVLAHAIIDALFGACAMGDIGTHFPDTAEEYRGISGRELLKRCSEELRAEGYEIVNIDSTVVAQKPKLMPYIPQMQKAIAEALGIEPSRVSVKAKTEEGLGFTGNETGISAYAVAMVERIKQERQ